MRPHVCQLIESGDYLEAVMETVLSGDGGDSGYWPDERYEASRRAIRETLEAIFIHRDSRESGEVPHA